ncbi:hypothetical protein DPEC_G00162890 [Dallia pectoralis]|uniref:Uncharacterized protein n=1 Tax=Dallia pectoralis TaxID=75939 RepID=A0ACC2GGM6_DALPE|nr:hypothetical protein DPEC_G00162890 [Dallia pectoralis]
MSHFTGDGKAKAPHSEGDISPMAWHPATTPTFLPLLEAGARTQRLFLFCIPLDLLSLLPSALPVRSPQGQRRPPLQPAFGGTYVAEEQREDWGDKAAHST